jgi:hypothetical protein
MKIIRNQYTTMGCQGKSCIHYGKDYEDIKIYEKGYGESGIYHDEFTSIWEGHECAKDKDRDKIRKEIYDRALTASDEIHKKETDISKISYTIKKASKAFDKIANEWRNIKCPFFEE